MDERIIKLLGELVDIESISGNEEAVTAFLSDRLEKQGYRVSLQEVTRGRHNLLALKGKPRLLYSTHLDTVAPFTPFSAEGEVLKGRGTCDAKGSMTAMLLAGEELASEGRDDFGYLFVAGEETTSDGARKSLELGLEPEYIILGEPTGNKVAAAQKGTLVFRLTVTGKAGHSALPSSGRSALHKMAEIIHDWIQYDWGDDSSRGKTTLNFGRITGGVSANVIAPSCQVDGIFRLACPFREIEQTVKGRTGRDKDIDFEVLSHSEPLDFMGLPGFEQEVVSFGSDAPYLKEMGRIVMCGPGSIIHAHSEDEQIELQDLRAGIDLYYRLAKAL